MSYVKFKNFIIIVLYIYPALLTNIVYSEDITNTEGIMDSLSICLTAEKMCMLTWSALEGMSFDIFYKSKADTREYTNQLANNIENTIANGIYTYTDIDSLNFKQRYYKVVISGTDIGLEDIGKFTIPVSVGMNLISIPLSTNSKKLDEIFSFQLTGSLYEYSSDRIWTIIDNNWKTAYLINTNGKYPDFDGKWFSGSTFSNIELEPGKAYWLEIRDNHVDEDIIIVGRIPKSDQMLKIDKGINLVGINYPNNISLEKSGLRESGLIGAMTENSSDRIWTIIDDNWKTAYLIDTNGAYPEYDGKWFSGSIESNIKLEPAKGYMLEVRNNHNEFIWLCPNPYNLEK